MVTSTSLMPMNWPVVGLKTGKARVTVGLRMVRASEMASLGILSALACLTLASAPFSPCTAALTEGFLLTANSAAPGEPGMQNTAAPL